MIGLEYARKQREMTMNDLAQELGVSQQLISMWVHGKKKVPDERLKRLSEVLHVDKELLMKELSSKEKKAIFNIVQTEKMQKMQDESDRLYIECINLSNRMDDDFCELFRQPGSVSDIKKMRKYIDFMTRMLDKAKKGEYDD